MTEPTFATNRDRLTWLLGEYKLLVSGMILGAFVLVIYYQPQLPGLPDWVAAITVGWLLLGVPCYLVGAKIARWLHYRNWETVFHINAVTDEREKYKVPPDTWTERDTDGAAPNIVNDGDDYEVREFEWFEDLAELRVTGTWLGAARDSALVTSKAHMDRIHDSLLEKAERLAQIRGEWSDKAVDLEEKIINTGAEARERGKMVDMTAAKDSWEEMRGRLDDGGDELLDVSHQDLAIDERGAPSANGSEPTNGETNE
ncbi:hypothetical protein GOC74_02560 [Halomicrobium mukohataei]|uniref:Uncharacterized protein n=1 Tax=Halomicrobium mukohataei TaxID=57705 RepID=A0A847U987_9EURY|nr:hypothetical protein [Halomicrobium mukohataei]NLV08817.1 hypothetical protein [Halomicrobium mukohataei]